MTVLREPESTWDHAMSATAALAAWLVRSLAPAELAETGDRAPKQFCLECTGLHVCPPLSN